jgi:hypothetical protein
VAERRSGRERSAAQRWDDFFRRLRRQGISARVLFAMFLGFLALAVQNSPLKQSTFLSTWDTALFDQVVRVHRNTVAGHAQPVVIATFGGKSREAWYQAHPEGAAGSRGVDDLPAATPLGVIADALNSANRMYARVAVVDIDVTARIADRRPEELKAFTDFLQTWEADPRAPLLVLVRSHLPRNPDEAGGAAAPSPWDALVASAPNIAWATSNGEASNDGVLRLQHYYECVSLNGKVQALASAPVTALTATLYPTPEGAKAALAAALARHPLCSPRKRIHTGGKADFELGPGFDLSPARGRPIRFDSQGGLIDYHLDDPERGGVAPPLPHGEWADGARALTMWDTGDLFDALGPDVGGGAIVIVGARQPLSPDLQWTPYSEIDGDLVLANAARGLALIGPIHDLPLWMQIAGLITMILAIHLFYRLNMVLNARAHGIDRGWLRFIVMGATSAAMSKLYALALLYAAGMVIGSWLLSLGYWQSTPFIGASIYVLMGDAIELIGGGKLEQGD